MGALRGVLHTELRQLAGEAGACLWLERRGKSVWSLRGSWGRVGLTCAYCGGRGLGLPCGGMRNTRGCTGLGCVLSQPVGLVCSVGTRYCNS